MDNNRLNIKKFYQSLRTGDNYYEIMKKYNLSDNEFNGILELFEIQGLRYEIDSKTGMFIKRNRYPYKKDIYQDENLEKISFVAVSDTHLCNKNSQEDLLNKVYAKAYLEKDCDFALHVGDITDGMYYHRKEQIYELHQFGAENQADYVASIYPEMKGMPTYLIEGNHDFTHMRENGVSIGNLISYKRDDIHNLGSTKAIKSLGKYDNLNIMLFHPTDGSTEALSYKPQKIIERMDQDEKPNLLLVGHYHDSIYLNYHNVHTFLVPALTARSQFQVSKSLRNTVGAYYIDLLVNDNGEIKDISFENDLFTADDLTKDNYKTAKKLVLNKHK